MGHRSLARSLCSPEYGTAPLSCHGQVIAIPGRFDYRYLKITRRPIRSILFLSHASRQGEFPIENKDPDAKVRILVVDDNEPFRRFVASMFRDRQNLNVIGEAGDGLEAVQRAEALQPDLILLDIGLPEVNGLDAARQISKLAPNARIIFLTQESASDVVGEALSLGAWGYVAKVQAGRELLVAVETVLQGQRFVSSSLNGHK